MADDFDRAMTSPLERVARTLAGHALSRNAEGDMASAGEAVDALWGEYSDAALAVLRTLREPSAAMLAVGDAEVWDRWNPAAIEEEPIADGDGAIGRAAGGEQGGQSVWNKEG